MGGECIDECVDVAIGTMVAVYADGMLVDANPVAASTDAPSSSFT